jgi:HSP20 family protein
MTAIERFRNEIIDFRNQPLDFFTSFNDMRNEMNYVLGKCLINSDNPWPLGRDAQAVCTVKADIIETKNEYKVLLDMPGIEEKDIDMSLDNGLLKITEKKEHLSEIKDTTIHSIERNYGSFTKTLRLPENILEDEIKAHFKNGVLELLLPKSEEAKKEIKKIKIISS